MITKTIGMRWLSAVALMVVSLGALAQDSAIFARSALFSIPPQSLASALIDFSTQSGVQVATTVEISKVQSKGVSGTRPLGEALTLLLDGTGLQFGAVGNTIAIRKNADSNPAVSLDIKDQASTQEHSLQVATASDASAALSKVNTQSTEPPRASSDAERTDSPELTVTGSRLRQTALQGAQATQVYTREQIERSGQGSISEFLNTLPEVSIASTAFGVRTTAGGGAVTLRGMPLGTTLVLINGRRIQNSGGQAGGGSNGIFDLNALPVSAVQRVEMVAAGSSAVYGSDAIAGVVNIILRENFSGAEFGAKFGAADGTDELLGHFALGESWSRGAMSVLGSYQRQTELAGAERALTATGDFRPYGGPDNRFPFFCSPGNVYSVDNVTPLPGVGATVAAVPAGFTGTPTQAIFATTAGMLNSCSTNPYYSRIPDAERWGAIVSGNYQLARSAELFTELMFSRTDQVVAQGPPSMVGLPGFQSYTVGPNNPFNPFGVRVGIGNRLVGVGRQETHLPTDFHRVLIGARGPAFSSWDWEIAAWQGRDQSTLTFNRQLNPTAVQAALNSNSPASALNPFIDDGSLGAPTLQPSLLGPDVVGRFDSQKLAANAWLRGSLAQLPAGAVQTVVGAEFSQDELDSDKTRYFGGTHDNYRRDTYAVFAELRLPILQGREQALEKFAVTAAGRYDHDEDFGSEATPQFGLEWRPTEALLLRGTYGHAFRAPNLFNLFGAVVSNVTVVSDPRNNNLQYAINRIGGGNPNLEPETGISHTAGIIYSPRSLPDLKFSATHWSLEEDGAIQSISFQTIVDYESLFPGRVIRNANTGLITQVDSSLVNFGTIDVRGIDYSVEWRHQSSLGQFSPSLRATQTYHYTTAFLPGLPATDRVSRANSDYLFAPRWKGTAGLDWSKDAFSATLIGRYVGRYRDYTPLSNGQYQQLGNFWLWDFNLRCSLGELMSAGSRWLEGAYLEVGGVNMFDELPQFSNNPLGSVGFDGTQADIRGRFLYGRFGVRW